MKTTTDCSGPVCPHCGGKLHGNGYNTALHCEDAEDDAYWHAAPDARPVYCIPNVRDQGSAPSTNSAEERNQSNE